jgi:Flp pilus assembly protein TadG
MTRWRTHRYDLRSSTGAAAVEFAIVAVLLLAIIFGIIDFGRLFFVVQGVKSASREGARVAAVKVANSQVYTTAANAAATAKGISGTGTMNIALTYCTDVGATPCTTFTSGSAPAFSGTSAPGSPSSGYTACGYAAGSGAVTAVTVTVTSTFQWLTPLGTLVGFLPNPDNAANPNLQNQKTVTGSTTMRCEG